MRIYADFNGLQRAREPDDGSVVPLDTYGTLCDLANALLVLMEGLELTIYDQSDDHEDLEAEATATFDSELNCWVARISASGIRYVPTQDQRVGQLVCVGCKANLHRLVQEKGLDAGIKCPACGLPAWTPILKPAGAHGAPSDA
jgi:hypothetical protein